jgi:hypothetical protein
MIFSLAIGAAAIVASAVYWFAMRSWYLEWGATDLEVSQAMRGDEAVPEPNYEATLAIGIHASPCIATTRSIACSGISTHRARVGFCRSSNT